jgi:xanthine/CO dehydrogenase XdhC/CoxF family maturation factor
MNHSGTSLGAFFRLYSRQGEALVLATVVHTIGSTYRKPGAQMLISGDGGAAGLLSGGCLETDLMDRATRVLRTGQALLIEYDSRSPDDIIWGMGLGCEGAMTILLSRLDATAGYEPFSFQERCREQDDRGAVAVATASSNPRYPLGLWLQSDGSLEVPRSLHDALAAAVDRSHELGDGAKAVDTDDATFLVFPVALPPRVLVLGAGPDAMPLVEIAGLMDWHITVLDHRPAYAVAAHFPQAHRVAVNDARTLAEELRHVRYDAAIVMSHHLPSDQAYLDALADSAVPYIGLLGPAPRRARLLHELGAKSRALEGRLYGPIGLDIGARTPQAIALAIVSEIHAVRSGKPGGSFSKVRREADSG